MKENKFFIIALFLVFLSIGFTSQHLGATQPDSLEFRIGLDKDSFLLREPVWVDIHLTNNGEETIRVKPLELPWLVLQVFLVNSGSDTLKYQGTCYDYYGILPERELAPGESYYLDISLLSSFGETTYGLEKGLGRFFLEEDIYTLQMYHDGIFSNKIEFTVGKPKNEEKRAHDLLKQAYYHDIRLENSKVIEILGQLISTYPKSVYADLAYYETAGHYGLVGKPEKTHGYLKKLILNYPNSHFALKALPGLLREMKKDEKVEFLNEIIEKRAKTKASDWAQESLKALEEEEGKEK